MKVHLNILAAVIAGVACSTAFADLPQKAATRIEFNSMIDQNNMERTELQKTTAAKSEDDQTTENKLDQKKVLDLVDVEVGVGEDRPVVMDRRYNSVGEPIVDTRFNSGNVKLVDDKKADKGS